MTDTDDLEAAIHEKVEQGYLKVVGRSDDGELLFQETEAAAELRDLRAEIARLQAELEADRTSFKEAWENAPCVVDEHEQLVAEVERLQAIVTSYQMTTEEP